MRNRRIIIFLLWTAFIFVLIALPGNYFPQPTPFIKLFSPDKIIHLILFAPFSFLFLQTPWVKNATNTKSYFYALILGIVYASCTELLQFFVFVGRNGNYFDAIADIFGVLIGVFLFHIKMKRLKKGAV